MLAIPLVLKFFFACITLGHVFMFHAKHVTFGACESHLMIFLRALESIIFST